MSEILYAWYSEKAAAQIGSSIYAREDGTEVEVTSVDREIEGGKDYLWDDKQYVGEVVRYVRSKKQRKTDYWQSMDNDLISHWALDRPHFISKILS